MQHTCLTVTALIGLLLAPLAQGAEADAARRPLTADERASCQAQLAEYNRNVEAYNARLPEVRALRAEIQAASAALDKDTAAVDQRDGAAMDAINARIVQNNERIERHQQLIAQLKQMGGEQDLRVTQFKAACEGRPDAPEPVAAPSAAPVAREACNKAGGQADVQRQIEATFATIRQGEKQHQAAVDRVMDERAKALSWNADQRSKAWMRVIGSAKVMAFEREKQPHVQELMRIMGSKPKSGQDECRLVQRIAALMPSIQAINARQYAAMADEIRGMK